MPLPVNAAATVHPPGDPAGRAPEPGFAHALDQATRTQRSTSAHAAPPYDPTRLPAVALGVMLDAYAGVITTHDPAGSRPVGEHLRARGFGTAGDISARPAPLGETVSSSTSRATAGPPAVAGATVIAAGERYLGIPYVWGGADPAVGFDCSGFVQQVYADLGVDLPRVSIDQSRVGQEVGSLEAAVPGDLVFWHGSGSRPNHIGIYAGGGQMLVAPRTGDVVRYQDISRTPDTIRRVTV